MGVIIVFVILFSLLGVLYVRDLRFETQGNYSGEIEDQSTVIKESARLFSEIVASVKELLLVKILNITADVKDKFTINRSIVMRPGQCKVDRAFRCVELQVDQEGDRIYFSFVNLEGIDSVLTKVETLTGTACKPHDEKVLFFPQEERGIILRDCTFVNGTSSFRISYYGATLSRGLDRTVIGYFSPSEG